LYSRSQGLTLVKDETCRYPVEGKRQVTVLEHIGPDFFFFFLIMTLSHRYFIYICGLKLKKIIILNKLN